MQFSLNFWSNAVQFEIDDLLIILGPSIKHNDEEPEVSLLTVGEYAGLEKL